MSDTPTPAPSAPSAPAAAPAAPAAPTGQAATATKTHHAAAQPRTPEGKFNGPPDPSKANAPAAGAETPPPAPKVWKVDGREFSDPDELAAYTAETAAEARALDAYRQRAEEAARRAAELEAKVKDPRKALSEEDRQALLREEVERFREQERLRAMTPEQRADYLERKAMREKIQAYESKEAERARLEAEAKQKADEERKAAETAEARELMKVEINEVISLTGLPPTPRNVQHVASVMLGAAAREVVYPPHVVARKVREEVLKERREEFKAADPAKLLADYPELIERLEALEDPAILRRLSKLGEKLRRLNLESLGAKPTAAPVPVATGAEVPGLERKPPPGDPKWADILEQRIRGGR